MKYALSLVTSALLLSACHAAGTQAQSAATKQPAISASASPAAPAPQTAGGFRFSQEEMHDIANPNKLSWRIFYDKPSTGKDAAWFDAVKRGDMAAVKRMVEAGQDIEAQDTGSLNQTALGWAAFIGYEDMVDYLLEKGANIRATDTGDVYNSLKSAVLGKNTAIVKKLHERLRAETDLNDQTVEDDGETLVMVAASNNRLETVEYLISQGANLNLVSQKRNQSALSYACERGHTQMQQLLIAKGAINHKTKKPSCN